MRSGNIITSETKRSNICATHIYYQFVCLFFANVTHFLWHPCGKQVEPGAVKSRKVVRGSEKGFLSNQLEGGN